MRHHRFAQAVRRARGTGTAPVAPNSGEGDGGDGQSRRARCAYCAVGQHDRTSANARRQRPLIKGRTTGPTREPVNIAAETFNAAIEAHVSRHGRGVTRSTDPTASPTIKKATGGQPFQVSTGTAGGPVERPPTRATGGQPENGWPRRCYCALPIGEGTSARYQSIAAIPQETFTGSHGRLVKRPPTRATVGADETSTASVPVSVTSMMCGGWAAVQVSTPSHCDCWQPHYRN